MVEFRQQMREILRQESIDILLASTSTLSILAHQERLFDNSSVTPAARMNDTTDIWLPRGGGYSACPSRPFATCFLEEVQYGARRRLDERDPQVNLGLYSVTFNNSIEADLLTLEAFKRFRQEAVARGFAYFLEVFPPNMTGAVPVEEVPFFVNDHICRMLAGIPMVARPQFLKIPYFGPQALEELVAYDPTMIVGVLGGGSGTSYDAFKLLFEAKKYGARVALFGRKIKNAEEPLSFIECLRQVADGNLSPEDAVAAYHDALAKRGIEPWRTLKNDLEVTATELRYTR